MGKSGTLAHRLAIIKLVRLRLDTVERPRSVRHEPKFEAPLRQLRRAQIQYTEEELALARWLQSGVGPRPTPRSTWLAVERAAQRYTT